MVHVQVRAACTTNANPNVFHAEVLACQGPTLAIEGGGEHQVLMILIFVNV